MQPWQCHSIIRNGSIWEATYHFLWVVCSSNIVAGLHRLWDITTFNTVYVTAGDHQKSFSFDKTVQTTVHIHFTIRTQTYCS